MKKKNIITIALGFVVTLLVLIIMSIHYTSDSKLVIYTKKDSYAYKYAKKHSLKTEIVSEKETQLLNKQIEEFTYNIEDHDITITKYAGISKRLIIPEEIEGKNVTKLGKGMMTSNKNVETIILPKTITEIEVGDFQNISIECYQSDYCKELKQNENLKVTILEDSVDVDFNNQTLPFSYEENEKHEIELIRYLGTSSTIIVPSTINGYPVTKISFQADSLEAIYLPSNISSISENFDSANLYQVRVAVIIVMLLSFLLFFLFNMKNQNQNLEQRTRNVIFIIISLLYLLIMGTFSLTIRNFETGPKTLLIQFMITSILYSTLMVFLKKANQEIEASEKNDKTQMEFIKNAKILVAETKEKDLIELITYSDPVSNKATEEIEKNILELLHSYDETKKDQIIEQIKKRNMLLKMNK